MAMEQEEVEMIISDKGEGKAMILEYLIKEMEARTLMKELKNMLKSPMKLKVEMLRTNTPMLSIWNEWKHKPPLSL